MIPKQNRLKSTTLTLCLALTIFSCLGQTKISSYEGGKAFIYKNPDYKTRAFSKILVVTNTRNKDKEWEDKFLKNFRQNEINVIGELDLLPPIKKYTEEEVKMICEKNGVDGVMTIVQTDEDVSSFMTYGYGFYQSSAWGVATINRQKRVYAQITLYDSQLGQNAAVVYGNSRYGGIYDSTDRILRRFTRMVINNLRPEGVLK